MASSTLGHCASEALGQRQTWSLMNFSNPHFERISESHRIEEETLPGYVAARYYPVRIGEVFASRYQVVGKLGFGIFIRSDSLGSELLQELSAYQRLDAGPTSHPGRGAVRTLLDSFIISGAGSEHQCLVHPPLWENIKTFLARNPIGRLPTVMLAFTLQRLFQALDYAQKCQVIHTDIKASNIMFGLEDPAVFERFEQAELDHPTARKETDGRIIYLSHDLEMRGDLGLPVLCDFGSAAWGEERHDEDVQPDVYRSPEVILRVPWSYEVDIWNVGCVVWDIFEGGHLFYGTDPEHGVYRSRAHLAEMIALLGPPPPEFVARGELSSKFFSEQGEFQAGIDVPPPISLGELETNLDGADKELFLRFMGKMLQWDPQHRQTAKQLLEDEWLKKHGG